MSKLDAALDSANKLLSRMDAWSPEAREAAAKARGQGSHWTGEGTRMRKPESKGQGGSGYGGGRNPQEVSANLHKEQYPHGVSYKEYKRIKEQGD